MNPISAYTRWLHTRWPAGTVEKLPEVRDDGSCNVPGVYIAGDLTGVPLLKFSLDTGARVVRTINADAAFQSLRARPIEEAKRVVDVAIVGGGVAGMAAAVEAKKLGLSHVVIEASEPFSTIANFPKAKPIYTYPEAMEPAGDLKVSAQVKEALLDELREQVAAAGIETRRAFVDRIKRVGDLLQVDLGKEEEPIFARRVVIAIGRSGNYRKLDVPGEDRERVYNRLHDPREFAGQDVLVVGGGDSALEGAIALAQSGARVTLSYRKAEFARPKPENVEKLKALEANPKADVTVEEPSSSWSGTPSGAFLKLPGAPDGSIRLLMASKVLAIGDREATLEDAAKKKVALKNDAVFALIGRAAPLDFFRKSGINVSGETRPLGWLLFALFFAFTIFLYNWKSGGALEKTFGAWPGNSPEQIAGLGGWFASQVEDRATLIGTLAVSMKGNSFYYTLLYSAAIVAFGIQRIRRRKTPYVTAQTITLMAVQVVPLFLLPELILPWMGYNGWFDSGFGATVANNLFESYVSVEEYAAKAWPDWGHPRAYWRAYGFILAWPLMIYNVFTDAPMLWWLIIAFVQTFVLIPGMIYFWGKGAYCGWICSCGALAETMGDTQRHKMPHGPFWNRLNMAGQAILAIAFALLAMRIVGWTLPDSAAGTWINSHFKQIVEGKVWSDEAGKNVLVNPVNYKWWVDVFLGGVIGVGLYFKYSGRVWCRFFCPLAALMHIYARFSRFRIFAEKKKCISCNVCTSVCHQGIDIMSFANKGLPMQDPECVRCSACVQSCPTGVLSFGQIGGDGNILKLDKLSASIVQAREGTGRGEGAINA
jgi:NosR/NirI family nitrous oxide reductase transcriptional regulator